MAVVRQTGSAFPLGGAFFGSKNFLPRFAFSASAVMRIETSMGRSRRCEASQRRSLPCPSKASQTQRACVTSAYWVQARGPLPFLCGGFWSMVKWRENYCAWIEQSKSGEFFFSPSPSCFLLSLSRGGYNEWIITVLRAFLAKTESTLVIPSILRPFLLPQLLLISLLWWNWFDEVGEWRGSVTSVIYIISLGACRHGQLHPRWAQGIHGTFIWRRLLWETKQHN